MTPSLSGFDIGEFVRDTLDEDLGERGDITSAAIIRADSRFTAAMRSRGAIVVAGLEIAAAFFRELDPDVAIVMSAADGDSADAGADLMRLSGRARPMLAAERAALNTVQHLSGIATMTRAYVDAIAGTGAVLLDTRKTIPGLRVLEKYAVSCGGGRNHRMRLDDQPMIKDNHIGIAGSVAAAVVAARRAGLTDIVVEVDRIDQIEPAIAAGADRLLLDNMPPATLREVVAAVAGRVPTEASGGVTLETIRAIAESGVDFVSVGRLTQSAPAADIGLDFALDRASG